MSSDGEGHGTARWNAEGAVRGGDDERRREAVGEVRDPKRQQRKGKKPKARRRRNSSAAAAAPAASSVSSHRNGRIPRDDSPGRSTSKAGNGKRKVTGVDSKSDAGGGRDGGCGDAGDDLKPECSVCMAQDSERYIKAPCCQAITHEACVQTWLEKQSSCILCRATVKSRADRRSYFAHTVTRDDLTKKEGEMEVRRQIVPRGSIAAEFRASRQKAKEEEDDAAQKRVIEMLERENGIGEIRDGDAAFGIASDFHARQKRLLEAFSSGGFHAQGSGGGSSSSGIGSTPGDAIDASEALARQLQEAERSAAANAARKAEEEIKRNEKFARQIAEEERRLEAEVCDRMKAEGGGGGGGGGDGDDRQAVRKAAWRKTQRKSEVDAGHGDRGSRARDCRVEIEGNGIQAKAGSQRCTQKCEGCDRSVSDGGRDGSKTESIANAKGKSKRVRTGSRRGSSGSDRSGSGDGGFGASSPRVKDKSRRGAGTAKEMTLDRKRDKVSDRRGDNATRWAGEDAAISLRSSDEEEMELNIEPSPAAAKSPKVENRDGERYTAGTGLSDDDEMADGADRARSDDKSEWTDGGGLFETCESPRGKKVVGRTSAISGGRGDGLGHGSSGESDEEYGGDPVVRRVSRANPLGKSSRNSTRESESGCRGTAADDTGSLPMFPTTGQAAKATSSSQDKGGRKMHSTAKRKRDRGIDHRVKHSRNSGVFSSTAPEAGIGGSARRVETGATVSVDGRSKRQTAKGYGPEWTLDGSIQQLAIEGDGDGGGSSRSGGVPDREIKKRCGANVGGRRNGGSSDSSGDSAFRGKEREQTCWGAKDAGLALTSPFVEEAETAAFFAVGGAGADTLIPLFEVADQRKRSREMTKLGTPNRVTQQATASTTALEAARAAQLDRRRKRSKEKTMKAGEKADRCGKGSGSVGRVRKSGGGATFKEEARRSGSCTSGGSRGGGATDSLRISDTGLLATSSSRSVCGSEKSSESGSGSERGSEMPGRRRCRSEHRPNRQRGASARSDSYPFSVGFCDGSGGSDADSGGDEGRRSGSSGSDGGADDADGWVGVQDAVRCAESGAVREARAAFVKDDEASDDVKGVDTVGDGQETEEEEEDESFLGSFTRATRHASGNEFGSVKRHRKPDQKSSEGRIADRSVRNFRLDEKAGVKKKAQKKKSGGYKVILGRKGKSGVKPKKRSPAVVVSGEESNGFSE